MNVEITIPTALRAYTGGRPRVQVEASTVDEALGRLTTEHDALAVHLFDSGKLRSFVNVYLGEDDVRHLPEKGATALKAGDLLTIVPSLAGGRSTP